MSNGNDVNPLWIVCVVGIGVLLWIVMQCSLTCSSNQKEYWAQSGMYPIGGVGPVPGTELSANYKIDNINNPNFTNVAVPLSREMSQFIINQPSESNSDCMLTPGGQCHLASGGLGICGPNLGDATQCYKTAATQFNMSSGTTGLPLSEEDKKKV